MWQARQIISLGCRWRIGSGDNIRVMHDPWLRGSANRWVPSPQPAGVYQLSVRDLLHENYKAWNIVKVRNLFSKDVTEKILETPLVSSVREDKVFWEAERNGCYSVKSGYKLAMRYIIGCLPTRSRLLERRVECTLNCPVCDEEIEDEFRILAMKVVILLVEWLCYSGAFGTIVMISFGMIMFKRHVKLEDMLLMFGMIGTQYISYRVIMTSMGLCFRDNSGHFMAGMTQWQQTVISSVEGEA
ncbi:hypothetical protein TSUD_195250 [Trifolium subterraneum]|nr:hypothetical protein TSUD_195250 [Trifolium subterraneum]